MKKKICTKCNQEVTGGSITLTNEKEITTLCMRCHREYTQDAKSITFSTDGIHVEK